MLPARGPLQGTAHTHTLKVSRWKKTLHVNANNKKAGVAILRSSTQTK